MKKAQSFVPEEVLIEKLSRRDQQAFHWLYDQYSGALYGVVLKIVRDEEQARDLLQDIFIKIWKNLEGYDPQKGRLFTWLLNIARNSAIDALRSNRSGARSGNNNTLSIQPDAENVYIVDSQHNTTQPNSDWIGIRDEVDKLRPERKQLIDMVYFEGYTHEEVAQELNIPLGTVKTRIRSALQELKQLFKL